MQQAPSVMFISVMFVFSVASAFTHSLVKSDSVCNVNSVSLGPQNSLEACAVACSTTPTCNFFASGKGAQAGVCSQLLANATCTNSCPSGYLIDETMDFYQLHRDGITGCTEARAPNCNPAATVDDGSCQGVDACVRTAEGACANCVTSGMCSNGNEGYRNPDFDTVYASRVPNGAISIDGNLRDWSAHDMSRCYTDVAFATTTGEEVVFEAHDGGVWYGPSDFSVKFMLAWDDTNLYLAAEITDDVLQVGETCYANGLQAAFEVGGPQSSSGAGMLQAQRSTDSAVSRLQLINLGLKPNQVSPTGAVCSSELPDPLGCCVSYELSQSESGFARMTRAAVLRNPISKVTTFEVAFAIADLFAEASHVDHWGEGLQFGFSFLVNDGDESTAQQGWAGYYPHSIVEGWNGGQKQPWKVGVLELRGADTSSMCGSCTGWTFFGTFILAPMLAAAAYGGYYYYRTRTGPPAGRTANPLAGADHMSVTPTITCAVPPISSTA